MKVLIVNTWDTYGGAARAAFRLHEALSQSGVDSTMLVDEKKSDADTVITLQNRNLKERILNGLNEVFRKLNICKFIYKLSLAKYKKTMAKGLSWFAPQIVSNKKLVNAINEINPDVVHLHWICNGFLSIEDIAKIKKPIVWSLHDMWAFTGGCHLVAECAKSIMCQKYIENCGNCPFLGSKKTKDLSFDILQRKKKSFAKVKNMTIVGLSKWMQSCARSSSVFSNRPVVNLPNPINTNLFKLLDKQNSRKLFNLAMDKKLVLFGAMFATSTPYKGFIELTGALNKISSQNVEFVVVGSNKPKNPPKLPCKTHYLGHLSDDVSLTSLYNACDVMIVPSKRENLSNVIMESLSCGLPVVAFNIGGNSDMVIHEINGYLAQPFDTSDLASGIDWVLNAKNYAELCKNAREKAVREFDYEVVAKKYVDLYEEILKA